MIEELYAEYRMIYHSIFRKFNHIKENVFQQIGDKVLIFFCANCIFLLNMKMEGRTENKIMTEILAEK